MLNARFGVLWRVLRCDTALSVDIVRACMRIHNLAIDDAGVDGAERDARVPLSGVMDAASHQALQANENTVRRLRDELHQQGRLNLQGVRTDRETSSTRYRITVALFGRNRPAPRQMGREHARVEALGLFKS